MKNALNSVVLREEIAFLTSMHENTVLHKATVEFLV